VSPIVIARPIFPTALEIVSMFRWNCVMLR